MLLESNEYYYCKSIMLSDSNRFNESHCYLVNYRTLLGKESTDLEYILYGIVVPAIGICGIFGNVCGIIDFGRRHNRKSVLKTYYNLMLALSVSDLVTIISMIGSYIALICTRLLPPDTFFETSVFAYIQYFSSPINKTSVLNGIYLMISLPFLNLFHFDVIIL